MKKIGYILPESDEKPCVMQIKGETDLGNKTFVNFEVFECNDVGIAQSTMGPEGTLANIDAQEFIDNLIKTFKTCGCNIKK